jgi:hypothetical protein
MSIETPTKKNKYDYEVSSSITEFVDKIPAEKMARWTEEALLASILSDYYVVEYDGESDYQGWGVVLLKTSGNYRNNYTYAWATLSWFYGSCSGCDPYENMSRLEVVNDLVSKITVHPDEEKARLVFAEKGW